MQAGTHVVEGVGSVHVAAALVQVSGRNTVVAVCTKQRDTISHDGVDGRVLASGVGVRAAGACTERTGAGLSYGAVVEC